MQSLSFTILCYLFDFFRLFLEIKSHNRHFHKTISEPKKENEVVVVLPNFFASGFWGDIIFIKLNSNHEINVSIFPF